jgi:hypothetical protein
MYISNIRAGAKDVVSMRKTIQKHDISPLSLPSGDREGNFDLKV